MNTWYERQGCYSLTGCMTDLFLALLVRLDHVCFCLWAKKLCDLLVKLLLDGCSICKLQASFDLWEQRVGIVVVPAECTLMPLQHRPLSTRMLFRAAHYCTRVQSALSHHAMSY